MAESARENETSPSRQHEGQQRSTSNSQPGSVASLHRTAGNQAVQRLHEEGSLGVKVSQPGDASEREAERVAERVTDPSRSESESVSVEGVQREATRGTSGVDGDAARRIEGLRAGGRPLPPSLRSYFEPRFGRSFGDVRIHTGATADEAVGSVDAEAFTIGRDVVFRSGNYRPGTREGRRLVAHELAHVVQQRAGPSVVHRQATRPEPNLARGEEARATESERTESDCPEREEGEYEWDRGRGFGLVPTDTLSLRPGASKYVNKPGVTHSWLFYGFQIASYSAMSGKSLLEDLIQPREFPNLPYVNAERQISIYGFGDCHGGDSLNSTLRERRAMSAFTHILPFPDTRVPISAGDIEGAPTGEYVVSNRGKESREKNRGVIIIDQDIGDWEQEEREDKEVDRGVIEQAKEDFREGAEKGSKVDEKYLKVLQYLEDESKDWETYTEEDMRSYFREVREYEGPENSWPDFRDNTSDGREILRNKLGGDRETKHVRHSIQFFLQEIRDGIRHLEKNFVGGTVNPYYGPRYLRDHINDKGENFDSIYYVYFNLGPDG
jgi:hypothetical protein